MSRIDVPNPSLWLATATGIDYPAIASDERVEADVVVIGAGIAGLTTALLLKRSGAAVALVQSTTLLMRPPLAVRRPTLGRC